MLTNTAPPSALDVTPARQPVPGAPCLTQASVGLRCEIDVMDECGGRRSIHIPAERPLTVFVDKRELVTQMTLGACPELLVLGWLRNRRLVSDVTDIESIILDWDAGAAALKTHRGVVDVQDRTAHPPVTTGCGAAAQRSTGTALRQR